MNRIMRTALVAMAVAASVFAAGCSDGDPWSGMQQSFDVTPAPMIIKFYAEPSTVKAGEGTTIFWEVADANAISIAAVSSTGESVPFSVQTAELSGSAAVPALAASADFVITATKKMAPAEGEEAGDAESETAGDVTASQTITVTVESAMAIEATISADKASVLPGEPVVITWGVTPAEGVTVAVAADSGEALTASDACAADAAAAAGCGVAYPEKTTVFTVTATDANDPENVVTQSVEVTVDEVTVEADIKVNGESEAKVSSIQNEVEVTWTVTPASAKVTVSANPAVASCTPELPSGQASDVTSAKCKLSAIPTTFTVSAVVGDRPAVEDRAEVLQGTVTAGIDIRSDEWAFEGETVNIGIALMEGIDPSAIAEVRLSDKVEGEKRITELSATEQTMVKVVVPMDGVDVTMVDAGGEEHRYDNRVRAITTTKIGVGDGNVITKLAIDPNDPSRHFVGAMIPTFEVKDNTTLLQTLIVDPDGNNRKIEIGDQLKRAINGKHPEYWHSDRVAGHIKTFPVNALTVQPGNSQRVFFGTTGGAFLSTDGGKTFSIVFHAAFVSKTGKDYPESRPSCRGKEQTAAPNAKENKNRVVALNQFCDIAVGATGRFIAATDVGAYALANVDEFMAKKTHDAIKGRDSVLTNHIVDDIECLDAECMTALAAADDGVYKTVDGGESWATFGAIGVRAYALAVLGEKVFAGTENGVYVADKASGAWTKLGLEGKVFSLAIDPTVGPFGMMLMAGTESGVKVTRDTAVTWSGIDLVGAEEVLSVAIAGADAGAGKKSIGVMIGSGSSVISGKTTVSTVAGGGSMPAPAAPEATAMAKGFANAANPLTFH